MLIRKASAEEMLRLWGYENEHDAPFTAGYFYRCIDEGKAIFWTLDDDGELIGELYVFLDLGDSDFADGKDRAYLCAFRIRKPYRGQGFGTKLMETALADLREKGYRSATIGVKSDEPLNVKLYQRLGFTEKIRDCHYDPCGFDDNGAPEYDEEGWWLLKKEL